MYCMCGLKVGTGPRLTSSDSDQRYSKEKDVVLGGRDRDQVTDRDRVGARVRGRHWVSV